MTNKIFKNPLSFKDYIIFSLVPILTILLGYVDSLIIVPRYDSYKKGLEIAVLALIFIFSFYTLLRLVGRVILSKYNISIKIIMTALSFITPLLFIFLSVIALLYSDLLFTGHRVQKLSNSVFYYLDSGDGETYCHYYYRYKKSIFLKSVYYERATDKDETCSCKQIDEQNIQLGEKGYLNLNTLKVKEIE